MPQKQVFWGEGYDPVNGMRYQQNSQNAHAWADGQTSYDARIVGIGRRERADGVLNGPEKKDSLDNAVRMDRAIFDPSPTARKTHDRFWLTGKLAIRQGLF